MINNILWDRMSIRSKYIYFKVQNNNHTNVKVGLANSNR